MGKGEALKVEEGVFNRHRFISELERDLRCPNESHSGFKKVNEIQTNHSST